MKQSRSPLLVLGLALCTPALADLTAEQIIEKNIEATGGRAAYEKQKSLIASGTIEMTMQGIKGTMVTYQANPDKIMAVMTIPQMGDFKQGYDGKIAWSSDKINGLRKLQGEERASFIRTANNSNLNWKSLYKSATVTGRVKVGERDTYAIKFVPKEGEPTTQYFDVETFLVLRADVVQVSAQGKIAVESYLSDYRIVGGVKMPFKTRMKTPVGDMILTLTSAKVNTPIDPATFAYPKKG